MKKSGFCFLLLLVGLVLIPSRAYAQPIKAVPGERTLKNLLATAIQPVGQTMYTWGGGWNAEDTGSGMGSTTIGLRPEWKEFYLKQTQDYKFTEEISEDTGGFKHINDGLDCSGFVGWTIYNVLNTENLKEGYVTFSSQMASKFAENGWGKFTNAENVEKHNPGDIMSGKGHVYICLGECDDGSIVVIHSSPCGVQINGTTTEDGNKNSLAIKLAEKYMRTYYSDWYEKYPACWRNESYLFYYDQMQWFVNNEQGSILVDPDNIKNMKAEKVLHLLFNE